MHTQAAGTNADSEEEGSLRSCVQLLFGVRGNKVSSASWVATYFQTHQNHRAKNYTKNQQHASHFLLTSAEAPVMTSPKNQIYIYISRIYIKTPSWYADFGGQNIFRKFQGNCKAQMQHW